MRKPNRKNQKNSKISRESSIFFTHRPRQTSNPGKARSLAAVATDVKHTAV